MTPETTSTNEHHDTPRAVLYLRVSSKSQVDTDYDPEGLSIPAQRSICQRKAELLGLTIVDEYVEPGRSATTVQNRPEYQAMMQRISTQRDVEYVIVYQLSRLNRNRIDDALVMLQMDAAKVKLVSATENIDDSPAGQMTRGILAAINQYRSASEGEDIARKLAHKAKLGGTISRAPLGYLNVKEDIDGRMVSAVALDPQRADLIRQGFVLYATGDYSLERLAQTMSDRGLTTRSTRRHPDAKHVSVNKWHSMLANPYYMGLTTYQGELFAGRHEALITPDLFALVGEILKERSAPTRRDRTHFHYLKKQLYCGRCEQAGRRSKLVYTQVTGNGGQYEYYFCVNRKKGLCDLPNLPVALVEHHVVEHYETLDLSDDFTNLITTSVSDALADEQSSIRDLETALTKRLTELDAREERLLDLAEEGLPQHKIRARINQLREDRARIEAERRQAGTAITTGADVLEQCLTLLADIGQLYRQANDPARGSLNDAIFKRLFLDEDGVRGTEIRPPFDDVLHAAASHRDKNANANNAPEHDHDVTAPQGVVLSLSHLLPPCEGKSSRGWNKRLMAVAVGFEPTVGLTPHIISSDAPSAARTRHRGVPYRTPARHPPVGLASGSDPVQEEDERRGPRRPRRAGGSAGRGRPGTSRAARPRRRPGEREVDTGATAREPADGTGRPRRARADGRVPPRRRRPARARAPPSQGCRRDLRRVRLPRAPAPPACGDRPRRAGAGVRARPRAAGSRVDHRRTAAPRGGDRGQLPP